MKVQTIILILEDGTEAEFIGPAIIDEDNQPVNYFWSEPYENPTMDGVIGLQVSEEIH